MKNIISTVLATFVSLTLFGQQNVKLEIKHNQGSSTYAINQASMSQGGENYNAKRMEYYMSSIALEHDGGTVTEIDSFWVLVNANSPASIDLGQFNVTNLEAIRFSIGVETPFNHQDPSLWPGGHPLAPRSPSMHWGWSAGYRFLAVEGKCGSNMAYTYELHSLGDPYYYSQRIETAGADDNGDLLITLNADYDRIFDDLLLGSGVIDHGDYPNNIKSLQNMRDRVFTSPEGNGNSDSPILGVENSIDESLVMVYPNPSTGVINIASAEDLNGAILEVYDNLGKTIFTQNVNNWNGQVSLEIQKSGHYILMLKNNNNVISRKSLIVSK